MLALLNQLTRAPSRFKPLARRASFRFHPGRFSVKERQLLIPVELRQAQGPPGTVPHEGSPPAATFLDRRPGISGRIGEADSAQPTRNDAHHGRLGFGLDSGLISLADGHFYTKSA